MTGRVLLAAILAGLAAGFVMGVIQHVRLTPLIIAAERFEVATATAHSHADSSASEPAPLEPETAPQGHTHAPEAPAAGGHEHPADAWAPGDGWERTAYTTLTAMLTAAGFALILTGLSYLTGLPVTRNNGLVWGVCGFIAVSLAPAAGLPPELPGTEAAGLFVRQAWWLGTIICTSLAIWLAVTARRWWWFPAAAVIAAFPHVVGAPRMPPEDTPLPASLAAEFVSSSLASNLVMWLLIGFFLSIFLNRAQEQKT
jgi:cobalt transporter subunit CbtA